MLGQSKRVNIWTNEEESRKFAWPHYTAFNGRTKVEKEKLGEQNLNKRKWWPLAADNVTQNNRSMKVWKLLTNQLGSLLIWSVMNWLWEWRRNRWHYGNILWVRRGNREAKKCYKKVIKTIYPRLKLKNWYVRKSSLWVFHKYFSPVIKFIHRMEWQ